MSDRSFPTRIWVGQSPCWRVPKPSFLPRRFFRAGYQQALSDFSVTDLLARLKSYHADSVPLNPEEIEILAVAFIQSLMPRLNGKLVAQYLAAVRGQSPDLSRAVLNLSLAALETELPDGFPEVEAPRFQDGDRLRWVSKHKATDWGMAIGRFYSFAPHRCRWQWCYLIWLDPDSPSAAWVRADIAWEEDLELMETEAQP